MEFYLFKSQGEAEAYARYLASTGEETNRGVSSLQRVRPGGMQGNPVKVINVFEVPSETPYIQGVAGPQLEGGTVYAAPKKYPGGGPQVEIGKDVNLKPVASYPVKDLSR